MSPPSDHNWLRPQLSAIIQCKCNRMESWNSRPTLKGLPPRSYFIARGTIVLYCLRWHSGMACANTHRPLHIPLQHTTLNSISVSESVCMYVFGCLCTPTQSYAIMCEHVLRKQTDSTVSGSFSYSRIYSMKLTFSRETDVRCPQQFSHVQRNK